MHVAKFHFVHAHKRYPLKYKKDNKIHPPLQGWDHAGILSVCVCVPFCSFQVLSSERELFSYSLKCH